MKRLGMIFRFLRMIYILLRGGVDVWNFNRNSAKTLWQLLEEIMNKDVVLVLFKGRACRIALTVRIVIIIARTEFVRQIKRVYPNGKEVHRGGIASISETIMRGEQLYDAVIRALWEECGVRIKIHHIHTPIHGAGLLEEYDSPEYAQKCDEHESSVYNGVLSMSVVETVQVHLPERPWIEHTRVIDDNGVKIHLEYWRPSLPEAFEAQIRALDG